MWLVMTSSFSSPQSTTRGHRLTLFARFSLTSFAPKFNSDFIQAERSSSLPRRQARWHCAGVTLCVAPWTAAEAAGSPGRRRFEFEPALNTIFGCKRHWCHCENGRTHCLFLIHSIDDTVKRKAFFVLLFYKQNRYRFSQV